MIAIRKATTSDLDILLSFSKQTFIESHGHSCTAQDLEVYLKKAFTTDQLKAELNNNNNIFHLIYYNNTLAGYSKIIPNYGLNNQQNITKLERIYVLKSFYGKKLGYELFLFNLKLSKTLNQKGMWLYVWTENHRAVNFYKKLGFDIVGEYDFKISATHSNPNHQMLLEY